MNIFGAILSTAILIIMAYLFIQHVHENEVQSLETQVQIERVVASVLLD